MSDEARRALVRVMEAAAAVVAMKLALDAVTAVEGYWYEVRGRYERVRDRVRERLELERTMRRERHGPAFEAWLATREAADNGAD